LLDDSAVLFLCSDLHFGGFVDQFERNRLDFEKLLQDIPNQGQELAPGKPVYSLVED
jgi:hypothetical protein